ncbi:MAG: DUF1016 domain-containing protein [Lachnospiraceae bacterium]|jgi:hypothetical protein|nr:hypothetical protein [uncultured Acetatifactor sp.]MCI9220101.1 DUF1016 domain-containing protein [Lachnospiraceae bacterium]
MNKLRILYDGVDNTITVMAKESDNPPIGLLDRTEGQMAFWGNTISMGVATYDNRRNFFRTCCHVGGLV